MGVTIPALNNLDDLDAAAIQAKYDLVEAWSKSIPYSDLSVYWEVAPLGPFFFDCDADDPTAGALSFQYVDEGGTHQTERFFRFKLPVNTKVGGTSSWLRNILARAVRPAGSTALTLRLRAYANSDYSDASPSPVATVVVAGGAAGRAGTYYETTYAMPAGKPYYELGIHSTTAAWQQVSLSGEIWYVPHEE